ncbi:MAG TPA: Stp1/IreP family PP2C-type Ser/Thr phosphatase, partial [Gaiellales bacterium]|nr:Stp1/IreP family PP2C-type Ser/Thr phosphatase [Gaiellales bacterium]
AHLIRDPLFMVADGVGGARAGELASRMCAEQFARADLSRELPGERLLAEVVRRANRAIHDRAATDAEAAGMGTTVVAALFDGQGTVAFAHVGDSRIYLLRGGVLRRLSEDHSLVSELVQSGRLTEAEAERHPQRNVVTRVLGTDPDVVVDTFSVSVEEDDLVLLCSDGLNTMVSEEQIAQLLAASLPAEQVARRLVQAARQGGGEDNVTAVVFRVGMPTPGIGAAAQERPQTARIVPLGAPGAPAAEAGPRGRVRAAVRAAVAGVVVAALVAAALAGLAAANFVGGDTATGRVAIYQGIPVDLPFGLRLYRLRYESNVSYGLLPQAQRARLFDQQVRSASSAYAVVHSLQAVYP